MEEMLKLEHFKGSLNKRFTVKGEGETIEMDLAEVNDNSERFGVREEATRTPFDLIFRAPKGTNAPQKLYTVSEQSIGERVMFLVPLGPEKPADKNSPMLYQAVFN